VKGQSIQNHLLHKLSLHPYSMHLQLFLLILYYSKESVHLFDFESCCSEDLCEFFL
jgi:hypothetical protein